MQLPDAEVLGWWLKALAYAAFAALGGLLGHITRAISAKEEINYVHAIVKSMAAGFTGLLVMLACTALGLSEQWTGVTVGVCGWLGADATIRILEKLAFKKLGVQGNERVE